MVYSYVPSPWTVESEVIRYRDEDDDENGITGLGADAAGAGGPSRLLWFVLGLAGAAAARQAGLWK